jgi:hypothetical protein
MNKGLLVFVYRSTGLRKNRTPHLRITDRHDKFTLIGEGVSGPFEPSATAPALVLVKEKRAGEEIVYAAPVDKDGNPRRLPFGGNFIFDHDSRFRNALPFFGAVPVYDWEGG